MAPAQIDIRPLSAALGAEIRNIDLADVNGTAFEAIRQAWREHLVLLFRGQTLSDAAFLDFSARLGELDRAPITVTGKPWNPDLPHLSVISNVVEDGQAIGGLGNSELIWHTDMSYADDPPIASLLYARAVPEAGGDTSFCNMYRAWEALPDETRRRIADLSCKHDSSHNSAGQTRKGFRDGFASRAEIPGAVHPLVCRHPETGRAVLYLGRRANAYIPELADAESDALLDALWSSATRPDHVWTHRWRVGDIVMWDNRCTMHRRDEFDPATRRIMHRSQVRGPRMQAAPA
jgi:taurine dioxygenase